MASAMERARGPLIRTIPTPPIPGGVAMAAMVSPVVVISATRRVSAPTLGGLQLQIARDLPLLRDREQVVDRPVEHQPDGKKAKNTVNTNGRLIMILACSGSGGAGLSFCCTNMETPMISGSMK
jgi:hypothetical protein